MVLCYQCTYSERLRRTIINNVKLVGITQPQVEGIDSLQDLIAYQAKVSNPKGQSDMTKASRLLKYCAAHGHWSVFEMGSMTLEITTTRDISRQILRHRSFSFQEFSQRYAESENFTITREARLQDETNRQNSIKTEDTESQEAFGFLQTTVLSTAVTAYREALARGVAKEQARVLLPEGLTETKMYMNGTIRSWIHYCELRCGNGTQAEHKEIADQVKAILLQQLPVLEEVLGA